MVLYFTSNVVSPPALIFMGKDKYENEDLIKHGFEEDVWFHVDKLSSAHVYLRLGPDQTWDNIPERLLADLAQLVKANSIEGNKRNNLTIIYTPWSNLKKTGDMDVGQVSFKKNNLVKRVHVAERINEIVNRLNKTKVERFPDLAQEKMNHERTLRKQQRLKDQERQQQEHEQIQKLKEKASERSYASIFENADMTGTSNYRNMDHDGDVEAFEEDFM
ncbi:Coiled-coil domain-containing protein 25 [Lobosporangium transversale]|uniref:Coiled-coil domain-containing protein 25-like protein n=1 Tax=Lobosporangium transversale TaxID=64571 RepID=A0A1Y2GDV0_9FUNG|nr:coiled-coil domain-containing protein 25-like protein [Lobosporangium transversale]KAF9916505.1 Coiled-coil domain-containing protein 25 [Lobosporangium transversale]ORZ08031.1 coiled-coil domain-containing protein 25-like protein [Lobosporangium transversale]|eukprot:XP_021878265.1 coiled-coil domain-containing protein 25-like protein [Lobosporangium transversale]